MVPGCVGYPDRWIHAALDVPPLNACLNFFSSRTFGVKSRKGVLSLARAHALDNQIFKSRATFLPVCQNSQLADSF